MPYIYIPVQSGVKKGTTVIVGLLHYYELMCNHSRFTGEPFAHMIVTYASKQKHLNVKKANVFLQT